MNAFLHTFLVIFPFAPIRAIAFLLLPRHILPVAFGPFATGFFPHRLQVLAMRTALGEELHHAPSMDPLEVYNIFHNIEYLLQTYRDLIKISNNMVFYSISSQCLSGLRKMPLLAPPRAEPSMGSRPLAVLRANPPRNPPRNALRGARLSWWARR